MELVTPRLRLDLLLPGDAGALFAHRADPAVARFQGWRPADVAEVRRFIEAQSTQPTPVGWFQRAIRLCDGGSLIGDLGVNLPEDSRDPVEFGVSVAPAHQGKGYASEIVLAVFDRLFDKLARHRIHASVDPRNLASVAMLRGLGMRQEAHHRQSLWLHGEWVDDVIFAMLRQEWQAAERHRG
ncbi:GNAT family N-acetyltransferase [Rhodanobacter sp. Col0626]|uniref:GNAT family N-acetyltransferase n=1 Tax=Rhodanobacter sp. Col0626 TaxID=3415679 RepID=UPI003CF9BD7A